MNGRTFKNRLCLNGFTYGDGNGNDNNNDVGLNIDIGDNGDGNDNDINFGHIDVIKSLCQSVSVMN